MPFLLLLVIKFWICPQVLLFELTEIISDQYCSHKTMRSKPHFINIEASRPFQNKTIIILLSRPSLIKLAVSRPTLPKTMFSRPSLAKAIFYQYQDHGMRTISDHLWPRLYFISIKTMHGLKTISDQSHVLRPQYF